MKRSLIVPLICFSVVCYAQEYYCHTSQAMDGVVLKVETWAQISDSTVVMKSSFKDNIQSATYKRIQSGNPSKVYFTDGVEKSSFTIMDLAGTIKGRSYSHTIMYRLVVENETELLMYCNKSPDK